MNEWPDVDRDEFGQMTCPVPRCDEPLCLVRTYTIPLIAEQAAHDDHDPDAATTTSWQIECIEGHVLRTSAEEARRTGLDPMNDDVPYDHMALHKAINALGGERL